MDRQQVYQEIEQTFGLVPSMFKPVPDDTLELEWRLFKTVQLSDGVIPQKYRELIGLAIAAVTKCQYCTLYHTEVAKLFGASDAEIEAAMHYAKTCSGWSTYINGLRVDPDTFKDEVLRACEHVRRTQGQTAEGGVTQSQPKAA